MTKQKLIDFLIPPVTEKQDLENEIITNKKFILMVSVTIASMIIAKLVSN